MTSPRPTSVSLSALPPPAPIDLDVVAGLLAGLDRDQRAAVTHGEGPLLVLAGPGAGKTHVVTRRIAWLIATKRARPEEILALTFTERAAEEMQARVDLLVPYGQAATTISTFHAFGDRLVRDHALELGLPGEPRVLGPAAAATLLGGAIERLSLDHYRPLADPTRHVSALVELFGRAKDEGAAPDDFRGLAATLMATRAPDAPDDGARRERAGRLGELAGAFEAYQRLLLEAGAIDHGDQLALAVRLLRDHPASRAAVRERFRYVMVDEFQDTNPAQLDLLELVVGRSGNVTVVGDDDQAIYAFRGAALENLLGFEDRFAQPRTVALRRNHRSRRPIVDAARRLIRHNDPHRLEARAGVDRTPVVVRRAKGRPVFARTFATVDAEADWVAAEVRERLVRGRAAGGLAVLVRTNADAEPVLRSLDMAGVPWTFSGGSRFASRPIVRELAAFLRFVADPGSSADCYTIVAAPPYGLGGEGLAAMLERTRRRRVALWETLQELDAQPGLLRLEPALRTILKRLVGDLRFALEESHRRSAGELLYGHLRRSGRLAQLIKAAEDGDPGLSDAARTFEIVRAAGQLLRDDRLAILIGHLDELLAGARGPEVDRESDDSVSVMTVHKAKGLEFETVFILGLSDGRFPGHGRREAVELPVELRRSGAASETSPLAEERRLCYVAMTRARDELILTAPAATSHGQSRRPSPFLAEALDRPPEPVAVAPFPVPVEAAARPRAAARRERLQPLSYSALDTYLGCPARYRYRYVLRVPEPAHHSLAVGVAMHQAVAAFNLSRMRGRPLDEAGTIAALDAHWSGEGFFSRDHEDARYAAARDALLRFRTADLAGGGPPAAAIEAPFDVVIEGVPVVGRIDRIDHGAEGTVVTDYKASDVRDPVRGRQRARGSLQLAIYALARASSEGLLPVAVQLHFLDSGLVARAPVESRRLETARSKVVAAAAGIQAEAFPARPDPIGCRSCPFRRLCPSAAA